MTDLMDDAWTYYLDGEMAFGEGETLEDNPHLPLTPAHDAWAEGWLDADARQVAREAARLQREARHA